MKTCQTLTKIALSVIALITTAATSNAQVLQNGNFQTPHITVGNTNDAPPEWTFINTNGDSGLQKVSGSGTNVDTSEYQFYFSSFGSTLPSASLASTTLGIYQDTGALQANTTYTFTIGEAVPGAGYGAAGGQGTFQIDLFGGTDLASATLLNHTDTVLTSPLTGDSSFVNESVSYTTGDTVTPGEDLIVAASAADGTAYHFFLVDGSLTSAPAVPEPSTWALMLGGLGLLVGALRLPRQNS